VGFERWQVVRVPFPFTDRAASKIRPALVLSAGHAPWPLDCPIGDLAAAGLPVPTVLRMKLFTLDARLIRAPLGQLAMPDRTRVAGALAQLWGEDK